MSSVRCLLVVALLAPVCAACADPPPRPSTGSSQSSRPAGSSTGAVDIAPFFDLFSPRHRTFGLAVATIDRQWQPQSTPMLIECLTYVRNKRSARDMLELLQRKTGREIGSNSDRWYEYLWKQDYQPHPSYAEFKARLYARIDPRFAEYFDNKPKSTIRLDEIRWGGVVRDGIPPLNHPKMTSASDATYLDESNIVFGIEIHGDARAYPKRILAWHEMFKDIVGGESVNGVYCTLCGSMILYRTHVGSTHHELGTSGFLYRSNKLMYDHATQSLWSTLKGQPVVGPLVGRGIQLERLHVVTTTWKKWRQQHPDTTVLSLDTGHRRDYGEGVAYRDYFATDRLMFTVPAPDTRLKNKAEVVALRTSPPAEDRLAIDLDFLKKHPVYHAQVGRHHVVILTDETGANRVYHADGVKFSSWDNQDMAIDRSNQRWRVSESDLTRSDGTKLKRFPAHRAFWFGWHAAFPNTRLIK